jgi:hypothetical protein
MSQSEHYEMLVLGSGEGGKNFCLGTWPSRDIALPSSSAN